MATWNLSILRLPAGLVLLEIISIRIEQVVQQLLQLEQILLYFKMVHNFLNLEIVEYFYNKGNLRCLKR